MNHCNPILNKLDKLISNNLFEKKQIILFGANKSSKQMKDYLEERGYQISAVVDNDKRKWQQAPFGIMTYKPEDYLMPFLDNRIILIVSQYYAEMTAQLEAMGYILNHHILIVQKLFRKYDTSVEAFESFEKQVLEGEKLYKGIREQHESKTIFLCPYTGNGDIYIIGLYLEQFIKQNLIKEYLVSVVGSACAKVGNMFSWQQMIILNQEESDALLAYVRLAGLKECNTFILNDCYQQVVNRRFRGYKNTDFRTMFQKVVFRLDDNRSEAKTDSLNSIHMGQLEIEKGKSVILSPYANTIANLPEDIWNEMAYRLVKRGYQLFTNIKDNEEKLISFSKPINVPFSEMKQIVEYAGAFIGLRSGLCDIISDATAKKIILYPEGRLFGSCSTYDYFSLVKMGLCDNALELEFGIEGYELLLDKILMNFVPCKR